MSRTHSLLSLYSAFDSLCAGWVVSFKLHDKENPGRQKYYI